MPEELSLTASVSMQSSAEIKSTIGSAKTSIAIKPIVGPGPRQAEILVTADTQNQFRQRLEEVVNEATRAAKETGNTIVIRLEGPAEWGGAEQVKEWIMVQPAKPGHIPNAFLDGHGSVPNNPAIAAITAAIRKGGARTLDLVNGWQQVADRVVYEHTIKSGGRILVYPNSVSATDPLLTTEHLWSFVERLNPFTADVALAVLAQLCEPSTGDRPKAPMLQPVRITAEAILQYKGIHRRGAE